MVPNSLKLQFDFFYILICDLNVRSVTYDAYNQYLEFANSPTVSVLILISKRELRLFGYVSKLSSSAKTFIPGKVNKKR